MEHLVPASFVSGLRKEYVCMCCYLFCECVRVCVYEINSVCGGMCWQKKWLEGWPASGSECTHWLSYYCVCCSVWVTAFLLQMDFQCKTGEMT